MPAPIDPAFSIAGPEWQLDGGTPVQGAPGAGGESFAGALASAMKSLSSAQADAAGAATALAAGKVDDPTQAVLALERARLAMQMAGQIRTKGVEAIRDLFHTQV